MIYTKAQVDKAVSHIWAEISQGVTATATPTAHILGGQPGAGKTRVGNAIQDRQACVSINGDEYRSEHPLHDELSKDEASYPELTQAFANEVSQRLLKQAVEAGLPLMIEGTMRNPAVPAATAAMLREHGYQVNAHVVTTSPDASWQSCQDRYQRQQQYLGYGRTVDKDIHDQAVAALPDTAAFLLGSGAVDRLTIHDRDGQVFSSDESAQAGLAAAWIIDRQYHALSYDPALSVDALLRANDITWLNDRLQGHEYDLDQQVIHSPVNQADDHLANAVRSYANGKAAQEPGLSEFEQDLYAQSLFAAIGAMSGAFQPAAVDSQQVAPCSEVTPSTACQKAVTAFISLLHSMQRSLDI